MNNPYRFIFRRFALWLRQSFSFLWLIAVAGYLAVLAGNALYRTYQSKQSTADLENQLTQANLEKERLQALLVYYNTDSFREKELRRTLLLQKPGETVYALPESSAARTAEQDSIDEAPKEAKKSASNLPIWQQWANYIWTGDR